MFPYTIDLAPVNQATHTGLSQCTHPWQGPNKPGTLTMFSFNKLKYMTLSKDTQTHTHTTNKRKAVLEVAMNPYCRRRGTANSFLILAPDECKAWIYGRFTPGGRSPTTVGIKYEPSGGGRGGRSQRLSDRIQEIHLIPKPGIET